MQEPKLKFIMLEGNKYTPQFSSEGAAGIDLFSPKEYKIPAGGDILIPLNLSTRFPKNWVFIIKEKSGMATRTKTSIGASVIDSDYTGNIHAHLFNHSNKEIEIKEGQKIVQGILIPVFMGKFEITTIDDGLQTVRGNKGFGSTGDYKN